MQYSAGFLAMHRHEADIRSAERELEFARAAAERAAETTEPAAPRPAREGFFARLRGHGRGSERLALR